MDPALLPKARMHISTVSSLIRHLWVFAALAAVAVAKDKPVQTQAPADVARSFYSTCIRLKVQGLPDDRAAKEIGAFLSADVLKLVETARAEQNVFIHEHPDEKPPLVEGNLFGSMWEGMTAFTLGTPVIYQDKVSIPVSLEYKEENDTARWVDVLVLVKGENGWKVFDIFFCAPWDFKPGPSLRALLSGK